MGPPERKPGSRMDHMSSPSTLTPGWVQAAWPAAHPLGVPGRRAGKLPKRRWCLRPSPGESRRGQPIKAGLPSGLRLWPRGYRSGPQWPGTHRNLGLDLFPRQQDLQFPTPDCPLCFMPSSPSQTPSSQLLSVLEDSAQVSSSRKSS